MISGEFDDLIDEAVRNATAAEPVAIWGILACVDHYVRVLLTREELGEGLARLIQAGRVAEAAPHMYFNPRGEPASGAFSGLSEQAYQQGCDFYRQLAQEAAQGDPDAS